jgi:uncharacterized protein with PIN domain
VIVVDSSAVIAIFRREGDAADFAQRIAADDGPMMSAANIVEISNVLRGSGQTLADAPAPNDSRALPVGHQTVRQATDRMG